MNGRFVPARAIALAYKMGFVVLLSCESESGVDVLYSRSQNGVLEVYNGTMVPILNISTGGSTRKGDLDRYSPEAGSDGVILFELKF